MIAYTYHRPALWLLVRMVVNTPKQLLEGLIVIQLLLAGKERIFGPGIATATMLTAGKQSI